MIWFTLFSADVFFDISSALRLVTVPTVQAWLLHCSFLIPCSSLRFCRWASCCSPPLSLAPLFYRHPDYTVFLFSFMVIVSIGSGKTFCCCIFSFCLLFVFVAGRRVCFFCVAGTLFCRHRVDAVFLFVWWCSVGPSMTASLYFHCIFFISPPLFGILFVVFVFSLSHRHWKKKSHQKHTTVFFNTTFLLYM